jgi:RNA recognition motif-containing protein
MSIDPFTGRNPSYCFVELVSKEQADHAMAELDGKDMLGRPVKIKPGIPKSSKDPAYGRRGTSTHGGTPSSPFLFDRWERTDAADHWYDYSASGRRLYVGGLPRMPNQPTADYEIRKLFDGFNMYVPHLAIFSRVTFIPLPDMLSLAFNSEAISKVVSPHPSKRSQPGNHYYLFVDLATAEEADAAVKALNGVGAVWGSKVHLSKARGIPRKPSERDRWEDGESESKN